MTGKERIWGSLLTIASSTKVVFSELLKFGPYFPCGIVAGACYFGEEEEVYKRKQTYRQCWSCLAVLSLLWNPYSKMILLTEIVMKTRSEMWMVNARLQDTPRTNPWYSVVTFSRVML